MKVKQFLFGGNGQEAFNSFTEYASETFATFETFKQTCQNLVLDYGWNGRTTVSLKDLEKDELESVKTFSVDDQELKEWFLEFTEHLR